MIGASSSMPMVEKVLSQRLCGRSGDGDESGTSGGTGGKGFCGGVEPAGRPVSGVIGGVTFTRTTILEARK